jgi:hypothetical protein
LASHDIERAYQELRSAGRVLMELSQGIEDEELRQTYLKDPRKKELLCELKTVAKQLIGEAAMS